MSVSFDVIRIPAVDMFDLFHSKADNSGVYLRICLFIYFYIFNFFILVVFYLVGLCSFYSIVLLLFSLYCPLSTIAMQILPVEGLKRFILSDPFVKPRRFSQSCVLFRP